MAQLSNTYESYDAVGNREELADKIWMITPEETPALSLIGRKSVVSVHPEWQTDTLATPSTSNNRPEGGEYNFTAITPTTRVGNYCQISSKEIVISQTQEVVSKAGRKSEMAREIAKKGVELKTDMEVTILSNQASSAGSGNAASNRTLGGLRAWLASNDDLGANGASGGFNSSTGLVTAATNGDQRAFTKAILDDIIEDVYNSGGNPSVFMCSTYVKRVFSTLMDGNDVALPRNNVAKNSQMSVVAAADLYVSDFGNISIVPNRQMTRAGASIARNGFLITPNMVSLGVLRDITTDRPAKTGDADKRVLITEYTLVCMNEAAHGVAADLYGLTAAS
jgi:hypothetical protein